MKENDIIEMFYIVISVEKSKITFGKSYEKRSDIVARCIQFCKKHNINITHGSAYKELKHKYYYYKDKCIKSIIENGKDLYNLRKSGAIEDKEIVDKLLQKGD